MELETELSKIRQHAKEMLELSLDRKRCEPIIKGLMYDQVPLLARRVLALEKMVQSLLEPFIRGSLKRRIKVELLALLGEAESEGT